MVFQFCPVCGNALSEREIGDEGMVPFCENCSRPWFSFSYPCVICAVADKDDNIALIKQAYVSNSYVCVAGYVKAGEDLESTAKREVEEETGLKVLYAEYINSYYYKKRDNLMAGFVAKVEKSEFVLSKEVDKAAWFTLEEALLQLREGSVAKELLLDYSRKIKKK